MIHILYLSLWYPNRKDAMSGLFVRKHATAASRHSKITVLHVMPDDNCSEVEIEHQVNEKVNEIYVYVPDINSGFFKNLYKLFYYFLGYHLGFNTVLRMYGKPNLVQSHILTRTGFMALFIKIRFGIPYLIFEHWSKFLPQNKAYNNNMHKRLTQLIVRKSAGIITVSNILKIGLIENGLNHSNFYRINNVVDDFFFKNTFTTDSNMKIRFLNISCFDENSKNLMGLIRSAAFIADKYSNFELILVGTGKDFQKIKEYASSYKALDTKITFTGELTPIQVKNQIDQSTCITQFSNFETAGIVIAEAMASGKYIISTNVGIAPEYINGTNGKLIEVGDEKALSDAMIEVLEGKKTNDLKESQVIAYKEFSFENVGKQLFEIYKKTLRF